MALTNTQNNISSLYISQVSKQLATYMIFHQGSSSSFLEIVSYMRSQDYFLSFRWSVNIRYILPD